MPSTPHHRIAVVRTGFGGLSSAVRLIDEGETDLALLERADAVGGVWRDNVYPRAACDVQGERFIRAAIEAALGDNDAAFAALERSIAEESPDIYREAPSTTGSACSTTPPGGSRSWRGSTPRCGSGQRAENVDERVPGLAEHSDP